MNLGFILKRKTKYFMVFVDYFLRNPMIRKSAIKFLGKDSGSKVYIWYKKLNNQSEVSEEITYLSPSSYNVYKKIIETIDQGQLKK